MQAISRTPKIHREEMLQYVFRPDMIKLNYPMNPLRPVDYPELESLRRLCMDTDIEQDPYVIKLRSGKFMQDSKTLCNVLTTRKTYCMDQLQKFYRKAIHISTELGIWPLDFYMRACIQKFVTGANSGIVSFNDVDEAEKVYLKKLFACVDIPAEGCSSHEDGLQVAPKVKCLIDFLVKAQDASFRGLVFVRTRAEVAVLAQLLSQHVQTKSTLKVSTFVGASTSINRKFEIGELVDVKNQENTLDNLRNGRSNLIVTTTVLEEGIDVSACNVVVCFDEPQNLVSFIQRRGRARKSASKFVLMSEEGGDPKILSTWQGLETEMIKMYMDEMRSMQKIQDLEATEEGEREFCVGSTGCVFPHLRFPLLRFRSCLLSTFRVYLCQDF